MNYALVSLLSGLLILAGIAGSILPFLPGLPVSYVGLFIFAWYTQFDLISVTSLIVFAALVALTVIFDVFAPALAAKGHKASGFGAAGAVIGTIGGVIVLGPIGIFLGPFIGAFVGELANTGATTEHAFRVAWAAVIGMVLGSVFKLLVGLTMLIYFLFAVI